MGRPHGFAPSPYARLDLLRNPFGELDGAERVEVAVVDLDPWADEVRRRLERPELPPIVVQLVGPPGSGKTTHLAVLARRFPGAGRIRWSAVEGWPAGLPPGEPLLVDDGHMMPGVLLDRALRRRAIVVATHRSLEDRLGREGADVVTVDVPGGTTLERVREIVRRRIEAVRRREGERPRIDPGHLATLHERHGHDLRALVGDLYDHVRQLREEDR